MKHRTRLERLERRIAPATNLPPFFAVADESEITPDMLAARVKIYVGVSPNDWDGHHEQTQDPT